MLYSNKSLMNKECIDEIQHLDTTLFIHDSHYKNKNYTDVIVENVDKLHLIINKEYYETIFKEQHEKEKLVEQLLMNQHKGNLILTYFITILGLISTLVLPYFFGLLLVNHIHTDLVLYLRFAITIPFIVLLYFTTNYIRKNHQYYNNFKNIYALMITKEQQNRFDDFNQTPSLNRIRVGGMRDTANKAILLPRLIVVVAFSLYMLIVMVFTPSDGNIVEVAKTMYGEIGESHFVLEEQNEIDALITIVTDDYFFGYIRNDSRYVIYDTDFNEIEFEHNLILEDNQSIKYSHLIDHYLQITVENEDEWIDDYYIYDLQTKEIITIDFIDDNLIPKEDYDKYTYQALYDGVIYNDTIYYEASYYGDEYIITVSNGDVTYTKLDGDYNISDLTATPDGLYFTNFYEGTLYRLSYDLVEVYTYDSDVIFNNIVIVGDTLYAFSQSDVGNIQLAYKVEGNSLQYQNTVNYTVRYANDYLVTGLSETNTSVYDEDLNVISEGLVITDKPTYSIVNLYEDSLLTRYTLDISDDEAYSITYRYTEDAYYVNINGYMSYNGDFYIFSTVFLPYLTFIVFVAGRTYLLYQNKKQQIRNFE